MELNWVAKLIWLIWLLILVIIWVSDIFNRNELYILLVVIWYSLVFIYYFLNIASIQFKNAEKMSFQKSNMVEKLIKVLFLISIFIFFVIIWDNYHVINKLKMSVWADLTFFKIISYYFMAIIITWIFYEVVDILKNTIISNESWKDDYRTKLKNELKVEILKELNLNK